METLQRARDLGEGVAYIDMGIWMALCIIVVDRTDN